MRTPNLSHDIKYNFITIEEALKLHPERAETYSPETLRKRWKKRQEIVESVLVKGLTRKQAAKKFNVSYGHVCYLVNDYLQWERDQRRSNRSSGK